MRPIAFVLVTGALGGAALAGVSVAGGCGGDDTATDTADSGADSATVPPIPASTYNGTGTSTGGLPTTSGGLPGSPDGGDQGDGAVPPSGGVSNPGKISCGDVECDAGAGGVCCLYDGGATTSCGRFLCPGTGDPGKTLAESCDETADCPTEEGGRQPQCCLDRFGTVCNNRCDVQLCKTDAECGDAGPCNPKTCRGVALHVCGVPDGCP
jgi:hypothetical protein